MISVFLLNNHSKIFKETCCSGGELTRKEIVQALGLCFSAMLYNYNRLEGAGIKHMSMLMQPGADVVVMIYPVQIKAFLITAVACEPFETSETAGEK